jgi:hypothetical protein
MSRYSPKPGDPVAFSAFAMVCLLIFAIVGLLLLARGTAN